MSVFLAQSVQNNLAELNEAESWHCSKVLRMNPGDAVEIIDGKGNYYQGTIKVSNPKKVIVEIQIPGLQLRKHNYYLHLAIAPTKNLDRIEWFIEKAIEIGIDEISFIITKNSERKILKTERLELIALSAVKQSKQAYLTKINPLEPIQTFITKHSPKEDCKLIAHCTNREAIEDISTLLVRNQSYLVMIGPEGDFTEDEVDFALKNQFKPVSLGTNRLRTETAGVYVSAAASILNK